jgi:hypothetical protein
MLQVNSPIDTYWRFSTRKSFGLSRGNRTASDSHSWILMRSKGFLPRSGPFAASCICARGSCICARDRICQSACWEMSSLGNQIAGFWAIRYVRCTSSVFEAVSGSLTRDALCLISSKTLQKPLCECACKARALFLLLTRKRRR